MAALLAIHSGRNPQQCRATPFRQRGLACLAASTERKFEGNAAELRDAAQRRGASPSLSNGEAQRAHVASTPTAGDGGVTAKRGLSCQGSGGAEGVSEQACDGLVLLPNPSHPRLLNLLCGTKRTSSRQI